MSLTLHFHPLSSFCQKVLVALHENATPFTPNIVDLMDANANARFKAIWPIGRFPVVRDESAGRTIPESSIIIEYLDQHFPGATRFVPADPDRARDVRQQDRFFDLYVNVPMQKVVTDRLRPNGQNDAFGVDQAKALLRTALEMTDKDMAAKTWAVGNSFTMADCAAAPALFYANMIFPFSGSFPHVARYLDRLKERPSFKRTLEEAKPYLSLVPKAK